MNNPNTDGTADPREITVLRTLGPILAKRWNEDNTITNYDEAKHYTVMRVTITHLIAGPCSLMHALEGLQVAPRLCIIRGAPKHPIQSDEVVRRNLEIFHDTPSHLFMVDVDDFDCLLFDPITEPKEAVREFVDTLPEPFRTASYVWQLSGSAGHPSKPRHKLRAHLWFWLARAMRCDQAEAWSRRWLPQADATVHRTVQVNYTANPIMPAGMVDPCVQRLGFYQGASDDLVLPDSMPVPELESRRAGVRRQHVDPRGKGSIVGAVCRAFEPEQIVDLFPEVFEDGRSPDRITWLQGGGTPEGICVTTDGLHLFNSHDSSPLGGHSANVFDFIRSHLFGHLDPKMDEDAAALDPTALPSYQATADWAREQPEVQAQLDVGKPEVAAVIEAARDEQAEHKLATSSEREQRITNLTRLIDEASGLDVLQHKVCREIGKIKDLDDSERELLARAANRRSAFFLKASGGSAHGMGMPLVRKWVQPVHSDGTAVYPDRGEDGKLLMTLANVQVLLHRVEVTCQYNVITKVQEVIVPGLDTTTDNYRDTVVTHVWSMATKAGFQCGRQTMLAYIAAVCEANQYNPVKEWAESAPWDGTDRIADLAATLVTPPEFSVTLKELIVRRWLIQAIAAAVSDQPIQLRGVLVLQGPQNIGKTRWLQRLCSPGLERMVLTGHHLDPRDKDSVKLAVSHWITELGELGSTLRKGDRDTLKALISKDHDKLRLPYAAAESTFQRRAVFCGSVNEDDFLNDPTGSTRWWPVPVVRVDADHMIDMQQVWAQVLVLWRSGEQHWMDESEMAQVQQVNTEFEVEDAIHDLVTRRYAWELLRCGGEASTAIRMLRMTSTQVCQAVGYDKPSASDLKRASVALRKLGARKAKRDRTGGRGWWVPIDATVVVAFEDMQR